MRSRDPLLLIAVLAPTLSCAPDRAAPPGETPAARELTAWPGTETSPRVSPDGTTLAFDATGGDEAGIFLMDLASGSVRRLASTTERDRRAAWSPDGESIAFTSMRGGSQGLWVIPVRGGEPRRLFDAGTDHVLTTPDWSPDGARIAFSRNDPNGPGNVTWGRSTIHTVDVADGTLTELTTTGDEWWPRWSADGEWLYYYVGLFDDIDAVNATTLEIRPAREAGLVGWSPTASPDGRHLAFVSDVAGFGLFVAPLTGRDHPVGIVMDGEPDLPSYLPDGSAIVFSRDTSSTLLVSLNLADHDLHVLAYGRSAEPLTSGGIAYLPDGARGRRIVRDRGTSVDTLVLSRDFIVDFAFSPDENHLVVSVPGEMNARHDLHLYDGDGNYIRQLTESGEVWRGFFWCDNRTLVFPSRERRDADRFRELWTVDVETGAREQVTAAQRLRTMPTACDREGARITFQYQRGDVTSLYTLDPSDPTVLTTVVESGTAGEWSPDGTRFVYLARRGGQTDLFIREPDGSDTRVTNDAVAEAEPHWLADGTHVIFSARRTNRGIWLVPLAVRD